MAFSLDLRTELQIGGVWTEVTDDVSTREPISISAGRTAEGSRTDPGSCSLTLNNRNGQYSPRNPLSPHYGLIGRNTPLRVSVHSGESYVDLDGDPANHVSTPDAAALDITGDLDVRAEVALDWNHPTASQALIGKWGQDGTERSWVLRVYQGQLRLSWSEDGSSDRTVFTPLDSPLRGAVRATLDVDNGAGMATATFYQADSLDGPWETIVSGDVAGPTSVYAGTADLYVGPQDPTTTPPRKPFVGKGFRFEVYDGIDGTLVAAPDFRNLTPGATSFTDSAGLTWTVSGAATVTNRQELFVGEVASWPVRWDTSGTDVWTPVQAAGILRRYGQGSRPLDSTLRRRIPAYAPLAYWPMEEGVNATQAYSPIDGVQPMAVFGVRWAANETLASSNPLPTLTTAASMSGTVPAPAETIDGWQVKWMYNIETGPATQRTFMVVHTTGTVARWDIRSGAGGSTVEGQSASGTVLFTQAINTGSDIFGQWNAINIRARQDGSDITWAITWQDVGGDYGTFFTTYPGTVGHVTGVGSPTAGFSSDLEGMAIGHVGVFGTFLSDAYFHAVDAWDGESAWERIARLASEEAAPVTLIGDSTDTTLMGPQKPARLLDLLQQCADADGGMLTERRDALALAYRARTSLYTQTPALALDYTAQGEIAPPLEPVDDDQHVRNDVTVKRIDGSAARAVLESGALSVQDPPDGVGRYDTSVDLNLHTDDQTEPLAYWHLHLGTWDDARYPRIHLNLAAGPHLIDDVLALQLGDKTTIDNPPAWLPPGQINQLVQGYTHTLSPYGWDTELVCVPAGPWDVAVADTALVRADTDGSELAAAADTTQTTVSVTVTAGPLWGPEDLPYDITVGGEQMTVTAVAGTSSPQTLTVTRSVNGITKSHAAGAAVSVPRPATAAL